MIPEEGVYSVSNQFEEGRGPPAGQSGHYQEHAMHMGQVAGKNLVEVGFRGLAPSH